MKRLTFCLALLALLIAGTVGAYRIIEVPEVGARTITMVMGGVAASGGCTSPQIFGWSMEDLEVTSGSPAGCTGNAVTTVTLGEGGEALVSSLPNPVDGSKSLKLLYLGDTASVPVTGGGNIGTLDFYIYFDTGWANWIAYLEFRYDDNNRVIITTTGSNTLEIAHKGNNSDFVELASTTTLEQDTWYRVIAKWDQTEDSGYSLSIQVGEEDAQTSTANLTGFATAPNLIKFYSNAADVVFDGLKVYNSWQ